MRFQGDIIENLTAAAQSQDENLIQELVIDEMANIIENDPNEMIKTLRYSKVKVDDTASKEELINLSVKNLYSNSIFQKNLAVTFTKKGSAAKHDYAGAEGDGGGGGNIISSIANMIGSIGKWGSSSKDLKAEESRTKARMFEKIFGSGKKRNWMPIIVVAGVLLIGAMVVWRVTAKNK
jgi:hypothetical protein|tara:strand:+ start:9885 stop:10421 length:537 start_codon:yes stop_codon:yes gene_type:complete